MAQKVSWMNNFMARIGFGKEYVDDVGRSGFGYADTMSTASLMGSGTVAARSRQMLYSKYQQMMADPIVSGALRNHCTAALGGHETSGDVVFLEAGIEAKKNAQAKALVDTLSKELSPLFNKIALNVAYNGVGYGDAYARLYVKKGQGVQDISCDEMMLPPLIQPYEVGNKTVVCEVAIGSRWRERLTMDQIVRLKMPRTMYTPQPLAIEKAWRTRITENDLEKLPVMPSLVGGSFLCEAEAQFDKYQAAMAGLVGQRVLDSIDESIFTAEVSGMSVEMRQEFMESIRRMLTSSKKLADDAVKSGVPVLTRIRHLLPVATNKQLLQVQGVNASGGSGGGRAGNIGVDDVLVHAKLLAGSLGSDITMLGFADMLSGGLGDGGFFRTSVQAAERSRIIRIALVDFFNHIIDVHLTYKTGRTFDQNNRPWKINFYGSISAMEAERERTKMDAINAAMLLVQVLTQAKDSGLDEAAMAHMLESECKLEAADAAMYAKSIAMAKKEADAQNAAGGFGGGGFPPGGDGQGQAGAQEGEPAPYGTQNQDD